MKITMTETRVTLSRERKLGWLSKPRPMVYCYFGKNLLHRLDQ